MDVMRKRNGGERDGWERELGRKEVKKQQAKIKKSEMFVWPFFNLYYIWISNSPSQCAISDAYETYYIEIEIIAYLIFRCVGKH